MTERSIYMKMSLEGTTFIKRCGLQRVVKCWKTSRLIENIETFRRLFGMFCNSETTSKIALRIEYVPLSEMRLFAV